MFKKIALALIGFYCLALWQAAAAKLILEEPLKTLLSGSDRIEKIEVELTYSQIRRITEFSQEPVVEDKVLLYVGYVKEEIEHFCFIVKEKGKHGYITFAVVLNHLGEIEGMAVMENKDVKGGRIGQKRFLRQFSGKSLKDPIRLRRDIDAVSGATISSLAAVKAARKALFIWKELE